MLGRIAPFSAQIAPDPGANTHAGCRHAPKSPRAQVQTPLAGVTSRCVVEFLDTVRDRLGLIMPR